MPIKDNRSSIEASNIMTEIGKTTDTIEQTSIIDTADFDNGVTFVFNIVAAAAPVDVTVILIEESDDPTMAGATTVPADNLIGILPTLTDADAANASLSTVGIFGTLRFIRANVAFTLSSNATSFVAWVYKTDEVKPAIHPNDFA